MKATILNIKVVKITVVLIFVLVNFTSMFAQSDVRQVVETEKSFAESAKVKGIKSTFLEFIADDGVLFQPDAVNGKKYWNSQGDSVGLLYRNLAFADISANGVLGYTTGPWSFAPNKEEKPTSFGDFITIWQKQPNGKYKFVLDVEVNHGKPEIVEKDWKSSNDKISNLEKSPVSTASNIFYDTATDKSLNEAYKMFIADDVRMYREGKMLILGKNAALAEVKKEKSNISFGKKMTLQSAGDLAFSSVTYELRKNGKPIEKGNTVQIWKFLDSKWQIILDVFHPTIEKKINL